MRICVVLFALVSLFGCGGTEDGTSRARSASTQSPTSSERDGPVDEAGFWQVIEEVRDTADGDPEEMAAALESRFSDADDDTLRAFQRQLVDASARLYTWQHGNAAEMICGFVSDDVFTDWRSWVISLGRETFERVAENPDNLADVEDLSGGCEGLGELVGATVAGIYFERHGYDDDSFPMLEPAESPQGQKVTDHAQIRAPLPRLSPRIPKDGLGKGPRTFNDAR